MTAYQKALYDAKIAIQDALEAAPDLKAYSLDREILQDIRERVENILDQEEAIERRAKEEGL